MLTDALPRSNVAHVKRWRHIGSGVYAPAPLSAAAPAYFTMLLPASAAALLDASWWVALLVCVPGFAWLTVLGRLAAADRGITTRAQAPTAPAVFGVITGTVTGIVAGQDVPGRYLGLALVVAMVVVDGATRTVWRRAYERAGNSAPPAESSAAP